MYSHSHEISRSGIKKINSFSKYGIMGLLFGVLFLISNQTVQATPPSNVTVKMYRLDQNGGNTNILCSSNDMNYGCTAYTNDPTRSYPFNTSTITIDMENYLLNGFQQGYLHNVTPHEVAITVSSQGNKSLSTVQAQAIAARTYTYYHIDVGSTINNSNQFQVYIPYTYEKLTAAQQQRVDAAMSQVLYMSPTSGSDAIRAHYGQDNDEWTQNGSETYLKSIYDPISAAYGQDIGTANGGMSSKGASRWGFGHTSSRGAVANNDPLYPHDNQGYGDPWSIRWDDAKQILTHYYTGIHIRDAANNNLRLTPAYRWNPLSVDWGSGATSPPQMLQGQTYNVIVNLQNTGTVNWTSTRNVRLSCRWKKPDGSLVNCSNSTAKIIKNVGTEATATLPVTPPLTNFPDGTYTLLIDAKQGSTWFYNRDIGNNRPWFTLEYRVCMGQNGCQAFLPLVMKNWVSGCDPYSGYWYPTGTNICNPPRTNCAQGDGQPDGVWAGSWKTGYHQVEFSPHYTQPRYKITNTPMVLTMPHLVKLSLRA